MRHDDTIRKNTILVIGDVMLDRYYRGSVARISPEAPVPVLLERECVSRPGGAANVAANLAANGQNVWILSAAGGDESGDSLRSLLRECGVSTELLVETKRQTTTKIRFLAENNQQLLRMDREETTAIDGDLEALLCGLLREHIASFDIVVLSDYQKGLLTGSFTRAAISIAHAHGIRTLVDAKDPDYRKYDGVFLLKPNRRELELLTGLPTASEELVRAASETLRESCHAAWVLTTLGQDGMLLTGENQYSLRLKATAREVYDVTGAGDTVIAYLAMGLADGMEISAAVELANEAAGCQVAKMGTSAVLLSEVKDVLNQRGKRSDKQLLQKELPDFRRRNREKKIVFTNGCFDILHAGHVQYLRQAAELGDLLVVGLNSDRSVARLKGAGRPVNTQEDRLALLSALEFVDYVVIFEEDTPLETISACQPDVLVKGGDYRKEEIVGRELVEDTGGCVRVLPFLEGHSSSGILKKLNTESGGNEYAGENKFAAGETPS